LCKILYNFREKKLIEEIILPTGISFKPTDLQLKEFAKRVKNFEKQPIIHILNEKLNEVQHNEKMFLVIIFFI
jgi:hypothetical protein